MRAVLLISLFIFQLYGCNPKSRHSDNKLQNQNLVLANLFIDAFYSFSSDKLKSILSNAPESMPALIYYQGWAEGGNYKIIERHSCEVRNDSLVICPVTVKDDLISALKIDFNVTDTFHIEIIDRKIISVTTSSNDPPLYYEAREWVQRNRPELIEEVCEGIWKDGTTPGECVKAMVKGYTEYIALKNGG